MTTSVTHECPNCKTNKNTIRIDDWDVKGTIYVDGYFTSVSTFHWLCKKCLYMWDQYQPNEGSVFDPEINKKEMANHKTCSGCGNPPIYCDCHG